MVTVKVKIGATSWQNQQNDYVPSKDSYQPGHPPSLIRVFAVCSMGSWGPKLSSCWQWRLWSDWAIWVFAGRTFILLVLSCHSSNYQRKFGDGGCRCWCWVASGGRWHFKQALSIILCSSPCKLFIKAMLLISVQGSIHCLYIVKLKKKRVSNESILLLLFSLHFINSAHHIILMTELW